MVWYSMILTERGVDIAFVFDDLERNELFSFCRTVLFG